MKRAVLVLVLFSIPAFPQAPAVHGTRIAQVQTAYLGDVSSSAANAFEITDRFNQIVGAARSSGNLREITVPNGVLVAPAAAKGPRVEFETWVEQRSRDYAESVVANITGMERDAGNATIHRSIRDNFRNTTVTYTVTVEPLAAADTYRVAFRDSSIAVPVPQIVRGGETIALDLSVDARTGRRMVEYIRAGTGAMKTRQDAPRDVYAEDAELTIAQPRLRMNGVELAAENLPDAVSGPTVWLDIPTQGRFVLSFKPRPEEGFTKAGEVSGNSMVLTVAGNIFRMDCADRIATGSGTYNIYARKDAAGAPARFAFGSQR